MNRPVITEFMGYDFTLSKAHKQYLENLKLWNYVQALDNYADSLEEKLSERYILVKWLNGKPLIDGSIYFDSKEECLEYYNNLIKLAGYDIEYTICRIYNAR